ncbi:BTB/POZ domain-containing protein 6-B-like [Oculina patagonica]
MSVVKKNWQTTRPTIRERSKYMFSNDLFSDVKFVVRGADGKSESKQVIPAYKFVLSISSPVFEAMFYGELAETGDSIELPDCDYESLLELFRYIYSDEAILSGSNVMGVLYLAKKYMVPSLAEKCTEYLQTKLDPSNVFSILPHVLKFEEEELAIRCWEVVDEQTEEAVKSGEFVTIERSILEAVVKRDALNIEEVELFKAVNLWATKKCEEQGLSTDGSEKRRILGERIVKGIRFPVMTQQEFAGVVLDCKILTPDEAFSVVKHLNSIPDTPVGFPDKKRTGLREWFHHCCRFGSVDHSGSDFPYLPDEKDYLIFTVDKDISLLGVILCGNKNNTYTVTLEIRYANASKAFFVSKSRSFSSVCIKSEPVSYYGFNIFFDRPVDIKKAIRYRIEASITGADSCLGKNGKKSVLCSGVTFNFENSSAMSRSNRTSVTMGQFPEFLFTVQ